MHQLRRFVSCGVMAAAAALALFTNAASAVATVPAPSPNTARFETTFLTNMIDHHAMAVHMAEMCPGKTVHGQLSTLCKNIATSQQREIGEMRSWLRTWYRTDHAPAMHMSPAETRAMHDMMTMSGKQFEIHFMTMMIPHHAQAVREARPCLTRAGHPQLRQLCGNIIKTQSAEIRTMRSWLCKWYKQCAGRSEKRHGSGHVLAA